MSYFHSTFSTIDIYHSAQSVTNTTTPCLCWCDTPSSISAELLLLLHIADWHCDWHSPPHCLTLCAYLSVCLSVCVGVCVCVCVVCRSIVSASLAASDSTHRHRPTCYLTVAHSRHGTWRHSSDDTHTSITCRRRNQAWIKTNLTEDKKERFKCESAAVNCKQINYNEIIRVNCML